MLLASDGLGVSPVKFVVALQALLVTVLFQLTWSAAIRPGSAALGLLLFGGPGMFPALWSNDLAGALRKELLFFAALALLVAASRNPSSAVRRALCLGATGLYVVGCAGHEVLSLLCPSMVIAFLALERANLLTRKWAWTLSGVSLVAAAAAGMFALMFPVSDDVAAQCAALTSRGVGKHMCTGALAWTDGDPSRYDHFMQLIYRTPRPWGSARAAVLAVLPFLYVHHVFGAQRRLLGLLMLHFLPLAPVFFVAIDWGRFGSIVLSAHAFTMVLLCNTGALQLKRKPAAWAAALCVAAALYVTPNHTLGWLERFR